MGGSGPNGDDHAEKDIAAHHRRKRRRKASDLAHSLGGWATRAALTLSGPIETFRVYEPLRHSPDLFRRVHVGEHGTDIVWSDEIDMAADTLWRLAREQAGVTLSPAAFKHWRERHAFTLDTAAAALGVSRRMVAYYEQGKKPIPRVVALATRGLDLFR